MYKEIHKYLFDESKDKENVNEFHNELMSSYFRFFEEKDENKCIEDYLNLIDCFFPMFLNFKSIFVEKKSAYDLCLFLRTMENYSSFYEKIIKTKKREIDFEKIKNILSNDQKINKHKKEKSKLENELIYIKENKENIENNKFFLIPFSSKKLEKIFDNKKTNVCQKCKFNCHKNCNHSSNSSCSCYDLNSKCMICPNNCLIKDHEIVKYEYPELGYQNLECLFYYYNLKDYNNNYSTISDLINKKEQDLKDLEKLIEELKESKNELKGNEEIIYEILNC